MHLAINSEADWYAAPRKALLGDCGCACDGNCHGCSMLGFMGAAATPMTVDEAWREAAASLNVPYQTSYGHASLDDLETKVANMHTIAWESGSFKWANPNFHPSQNLKLVSTASGLGLATAGVVSSSLISSAGGAAAASAAGGAAGAAAAMSAAIPFIGLGVAGLIGIWSIMSSHHAAAVAQEQSDYDTANSAAENYMQLIQQGVASGQITPAHAIDALNSMFDGYMQATAASARNNPCNANCLGRMVLKANVIYWSAQYQAMEDAAKSQAGSALPATSSGGAVVPMPQTVPGGGGTLVNLATGSATQAAAPASMPSWLPIAAAVALAFVILK